MLITQQGQILRIRTGTIRPIGRATQGVRLIVVEEGDKVVSIVRVADSGINGDEPNGDPVEGIGDGGSDEGVVEASAEGNGEAQASAEQPDASDASEPPSEE
jgi:DNA gyrase subunit A